VSTEYMATPYKKAYSGVKSDYNYFHSQVRITIECTFGMLVHRWSILRRPLPARMGVRKQIALTLVLTKLHNFCIGDTGPSRTLEPLTTSDELFAVNNGGIDVDPNSGPDELLANPVFAHFFVV